MFKRIAKKFIELLPKRLTNYIYYHHKDYKHHQYGEISFSQEGEDMVLRRLFPFKTEGFYVDIGAHHPSFCSNTKHFYNLGWNGINIEPIPGTKKIFDEERPRDINLEISISERKEEVNFHVFNPSLMNTISNEQMTENQQHEWCTFIETLKIKSLTLAEVLDTYLTKDQVIDFMSIDVENAEIQVLKSNDWKYSPKIIVIEINGIEINEVYDSAVYLFLVERGYTFFSKIGNSYFFKHHTFKENG